MSYSKPAPGELETVRAFVNTWHVDEHTDRIDSPAGLGEWLAETGLSRSAKRPTAAEHAAAIALREAIRSLLLANNGEPLDPSALESLNRAEIGRASCR